MKTTDLLRLFRKNILELEPYSSARSEFNGTATVFLDANENSFDSAAGTGYNRYPDPMQRVLKQEITALKNIAADQILIGNGSDEPIDLLIRAVCVPGRDSIMICPPTYGMYEVAAKINDVQVREVPLKKGFQLDVENILAQIDDRTKLLFICSPNNPTGNVLQEEDITILLQHFNGILVLDEAYIDFAESPSWLAKLNQYPGLVILQTLSKAWGLAGLRVGIAFASAEIIAILNKLKPPYNVNEASQQLAVQSLRNAGVVAAQVKALTEQRDLLAGRLKQFAFVQEVFPSDANFLLVRVQDAHALYRHLLHAGIVVRNRSSLPLCENCLRITIGTPPENQFLLQQLAQFNS